MEATPVIELTLTDHGNPPLAINPGAVVAVKPRKSLRPDIANQSPATILTWAGAQITLPSGVTFNVEEDYAAVLALLTPPPPPEAPEGGRVTLDIPEPTPEPAPAKKAAAKAPPKPAAPPADDAANADA
jgi:hypothetical protein